MTPPAALGADWPMLVGGRSTRAVDGSTYATSSPSTGELLAHVPDAGPEDVDATVRAAVAAAAGWADVPPRVRAGLLRTVAGVVREHRAELAELDARDCGHPVTAMAGDVDLAAELLDSYADWWLALGGTTMPGDRSHLHYTVREPYGVVVRIVPYNHPLMFAATRLAAPLLAGNTVILKAPDQAPLSTLRLGQLLADVVPPGVVSFLSGSGPVVGPALVAHPAVRRIAFTGSVETGRRVLATAAGAGIKHVTLELGGKNPMVVFPDADPVEAAAGAVAGMNFHWTGGQSCGSTSRLLVHRSLLAEVAERVVETTRRIRVGDPLDPATEMGCMVTPEHRDRVAGYIDRAQGDGLRLATGGSAAVGYGTGSDAAFVPPTVFLDVPPTAELSRAEVFGPVLAISAFDTEREAVDLVNGSELGLTASIWTADLSRAHRVVRSVQAGYVWVNTASRHFAGLPFGGVKDSGLGREESIEELHSFTQSKAVTIRLEGS